MQRGPGRCEQEGLAHEALQLLGDVSGHLGAGAAVLELARGGGVFGQDEPGQPRDLVGDQGEPAAPFGQALGEGGLIGRQRLDQKGAVEREVDDLRAQFLERAQRHEGHGHFLQVGDVLLEVLQRIADLQREQPAQARAVARGSHFGLVEDFEGDGITVVDERGKTDQGLCATADFHQLGQFTEGPAGVAGVGRGGVRRFSFCSST